MSGWLDQLLTAAAALDHAVLAIAVATVMVSGFVRGFVGFGSSLIIVMVLSVHLGPITAVAIAGLSGLAPVMQLLPAAIRHSERSFVIPFALLTFVAAPIGTWVLVTADPAIMKIVISGFVLLMVGMLYFNWRHKGMKDTRFLVATGAVSGLIQGGAGVGGPLAVAIALARDAIPQTQRANVIGSTTGLTFCGLPPLWWNGVFTFEVIAISIAAAPFYTLGTWMGARVFAVHGSRYFRNAALLALAVVGVATMALAVIDVAGKSL